MMTKYLLYERKIVIGHEAVRLQLFRNQKNFLLERRLVQQDSVALEQVLPINSTADLDSFSADDPYVRQLAKCYSEIRERISPWVDQPVAVNDDTLQKIFSTIVAAPDESALSSSVRELVSELGAESYVFVSLHPDDYSVERASHRFLIGCRPGWCQVYNAKKWYLIDPYIEYSRTNTLPILGSETVPNTQGQNELLAAADENGFRSRLIVPAHASTNGRIGVLYIGSDIPPSQGETLFTANRMFFRALSLELLDWSSQSLKRQILLQHQLNEGDVDLIRLVRDGFTANDIAREFGLSTRTIHNRFTQLNKKIGVTHISAVVKFAEAYGIFS